MAMVRRCLEDILVCTFAESLSESIAGVIRSTAHELKLQVEKLEEDVSQFLNLRIQVNQ